MGNKLKGEAEPIVSAYLKLPLRDLADAVAAMEARKAINQKLGQKLTAPTETHRSLNKYAVHCRSGFHAR